MEWGGRWGKRQEGWGREREDGGLGGQRGGATMRNQLRASKKNGAKKEGATGVVLSFSSPPPTSLPRRDAPPRIFTVIEAETETHRQGPAGVRRVH